MSRAKPTPLVSDPDVRGDCVCDRDEMAYTLEERDAVLVIVERDHKTIENLRAQLAALENSLARTESARLTLLGFLLAVDNVIRPRRADVTTGMLLDWLTRASRQAHTAHTRAWTPNAGSTPVSRP